MTLFVGRKRLSDLMAGHRSLSAFVGDPFASTSTAGPRLLLEAAFDDFESRRMGEQRVQAVGLPLLAGRVVAHPSSEVPDAVEVLTRLEQAGGKPFEVEPQVSASVLPQAVVQVEAVHVGSYLCHCSPHYSGDLANAALVGYAVLTPPG